MSPTEARPQRRSDHPERARCALPGRWDILLRFRGATPVIGDRGGIISNVFCPQSTPPADKLPMRLQLVALGAPSSSK